MKCYTNAHRSVQMDKTLYLKFTQNMDLYEELLATGDAELIEVSLRSLSYQRCMLTTIVYVSRTLTKTRFGVVARMAKGKTSLEKV